MRSLLLLCCLAGLAATAPPAGSKLPPEIFRSWVHSFEEDPSPEGPRPVEVFRPSTYSFPRARGRGAFEVRADGVFVSHEPGRSDRSESTVGEWTARDAMCLVVSFPEQRRKTYIEIVSLKSEVLQVRRWQE